MNKKVIVIFVIILIAIIAVIFVKNKIDIGKIDYEIVQPQNYNYFIYHKNEKVGVIDRSGKTIIEAKYESIAIPNPEKDIFICYLENRNIALNSSNEALFDEYESVEQVELKNKVNVLCFEKNVLKYKKDGKYGLIDLSGNIITKNKYTSIENLQGTEGKFLVSKDGKLGVINLNGVELVKTEYDSIRTDGYYEENTKYVNAGFITSIRTNDGYRYGYVSYAGKKVLNEQYNEITRVPNKQEIYLIASKDGRYGLYKDSKRIIAHEYQSISYTDNGALIIQKNKNYGISNLDGKILVDTKFTNIEAKGIYIYAENTNENIVFNANGEKQDINFNKVVYETENKKYRIVTLLNNNIIYYGIENSDGETLVPPSYNYIEYVYNDYFVAKDDTGNLGVINSTGAVLVDFKYDTLQKVKEKNILQAIAPKSNKTEIYSSKLEIVCTMQNAILDNENGYIAVISDKDIQYFDENGNPLKEDSGILESIKLKNFPEAIGEYKKVQTSIDNIYYE